MAFRFSLATLLRLREIAEQREERLLGQIQNHVVKSRQTLIELEAQRRMLITQRELAVQQLSSAAEMVSFYDRVRMIEELERSGREQLTKVEALRDQQMKVYEDAHRKRDLISGMREDHLEEYRREQARQEQNAMDDNFSSRRHFR